MRPKKLGQAGISLFEVIVLLGIVSLITYSAIYSNSMLIQQGRNVASKGQFAVVASNITALVQNSASWTATINNASAASGLQCLKPPGTPCTQDGTPGGQPITGASFALYDASGAIYYDATNAGTGVNTYGNICSTFVTPPGSPTDNCVFRFDLKWSAICTSPCINPQILIQAPMLYNTNANPPVVMNYTQFSISNLYR